MHPECEKCIHARTERFGPKAGELVCDLIRKDPLEGLDVSGYTEEDKKALASILDPVEWAKNELQLNLFDYQALIVRCSATRKLLRCGRRMGKSLVLSVHSFHYALTHERKKIIVMAPLEVQVKLIFQNFDDWFERFPHLKTLVAKRGHNPDRLTFKNGSYILGVTAGTKSGHGASSARGQEADIIYLDEADYLNPEDIATVYVMLRQTNPDSTDEKQLWACSTPTGKREKFYEWANSPSFKEFHYPSQISPLWNDKIEQEMQNEYGGVTATAYAHEVRAEWGDTNQGVFQNIFIERAMKNAYDYFGSHGAWTYTTSQPISGCMYVMGVDWNSSNNGTQIVVLEYNTGLIKPSDHEKGIKGRFRIATRSNIDAKEFTQSKAVEEIIRLNEVWRPRYIYVDAGYGHTNIEQLKKYGLTHPASGLQDKIKGINFSSVQEVRDPRTKALVKKPMKPFMVNNAVNYFERDAIILSNNDRDTIRQLRNYAIDHTTQDGRPVYEKGNDHILDAFNLALLGFTVEFTDLNKVTFANIIRSGKALNESQPSNPFMQDPPSVKVEDPLAPKKMTIVPREIHRDNRMQAKMSRLVDKGKYRTGMFGPTRRVQL
jgi:replicative DNA helicase